MTTTTPDIRALNRWLKVNIPFHARAIRRPHREIVIGAETGKDLHTYADAIRAELGNSVREVRAYGLSNYLSIIG